MLLRYLTSPTIHLFISVSFIDLHISLITNLRYSTIFSLEPFNSPLRYIVIQNYNNVYYLGTKNGTTHIITSGTSWEQLMVHKKALFIMSCSTLLKSRISRSMHINMDLMCWRLFHSFMYYGLKDLLVTFPNIIWLCQHNELNTSYTMEQQLHEEPNVFLLNIWFDCLNLTNWKWAILQAKNESMTTIVLDCFYFLEKKSHCFQKIS